MTRAALAYIVFHTAFLAGYHTAPRPDEYILVAYNEGRESVLIDVIEGEVR